MPIIKNKMSVGMPIRKEVLLEMMLIKRSSDPSNNIFSGVKDIDFLLS
jgi:hypothetical protein